MSRVAPTDSSYKQSASPSSILANLIDQVTAQIQAGEPIDWDGLVREHPEQADELHRLRPALAVLDELSRSGSSGVAVAPGGGDDGVAGTLGDFRIVREIGRGGMGVVYEAEQISLRRRVALKVLPLAATMDPRHLQRFHNEAQAAACLHHGHIVPVFYVGCERGVHFYAMQLIEGQTLAAVIRELRREAGEPGTKVPAGDRAPKAVGEPPAEGEPPTVPHVHRPAPTAETLARASLSTHGPRRGKEYCRKVAEIGIQAAEALDYAHERGVIHRDVKPGNLMLDGYGALWVTDFGLAHLQHAEGSLTMTGDLVGTLRYMSPEQAMGKRVVVDHRTDVYSLGVTLYEILTLQPAFTGQDRQELLRQVAVEEPVRPRKLNRNIPAELETIVLKAMEKYAQDRYATAQEVADDLRRFLADRPIKARRPSLRQVAAKWVRRHRPVVWAVAAVLLAVAVLAGANGLTWAQKRAAAEWEADLALEETIPLQAAGKWPEALAAFRPARALAEGGALGPALRQRIAKRQVELEMAARLEELRVPQSGGKHEYFDNTWTNHAYEGTFREFGIDVTVLDVAESVERIRVTSIPLELATALDDWGLSCRDLSMADRAKLLFNVARGADPDHWRNRMRAAIERADLATLKDLAASNRVDTLPPLTVNLLGRALIGLGAHQQAVDLLRRVQLDHPGDFWINCILADALTDLKPPLWDDALRFSAVALAIRPKSGPAYDNLGYALYGKGAVDQSIIAFHKAIQLNPNLANAYNSLGAAQHAKGRLREAAAAYRKAIQLRPKLAPAHDNLGNVLEDEDAWQEAINAHRQAILLEPKFAAAHYNLGRSFKHLGAWKDAIAAFQSAVHYDPSDWDARLALADTFWRAEAFVDALAVCDELLRSRPEWAEAHVVRGNALKSKREIIQAVSAYREAIKLKPSCAPAHSNLGGALTMQGLLEEAVAEYRKAIQYKEDYSDAHYGLGTVLLKKGRFDEAVAAFRHAIQHKEDYAEAHCNLGHVLRRKGQFQEAAQEFRRGHELGSPRPGWRYPSEDWLREAERLAHLQARLSAVLMGKDKPTNAAEALGFAQVCGLAEKRYAAAVRFYAEAFAGQQELAANQQAGHRYDAACAAALASCGQGKDAADLTAMERARLRGKALDWLRADLAACNRLLETDSEKARPVIASKMRHWLQDPDFNGVRGSVALAKLTEVQRSAWQELWADVANTVARAQAKTAPPTKPPAK
jgi:serine/threonine protein kinase/Flp pilus assembly protein TadD